MSAIGVRKFDRGLDVRRLPETTEGVLIKAVDGRITRGGEFEKRAAFVPTHELPAGTVSLAATTDVSYRAIYDRSRHKGFVAGIGPNGYRVNLRSAVKRTRNKIQALDPKFPGDRMLQGVRLPLPQAGLTGERGNDAVEAISAVVPART